MKVAAAQLQEQSGDDRMLFTDTAAVVLDGATSHDPGTPPAGSYVDTLLAEIGSRIDSSDNLKTVLAQAIRSTACRLGLQSGVAPSSTAAMVRENGDALDVLVLGDTPVAIGREGSDLEVISDDRLADLHLPESRQYRARLKSGTGYDAAHRGLLETLQQAQRQRRNRPGGYWIAEADPTAAAHAITASYPLDSVRWVVLATDGVTKPAVPLGLSWPDFAELDSDGLARLLDRCHRWEASTDPDGLLQPRSKRHDDKTVVVAHW
ncbi:PP2C family serine/threonine-protein phosphatase [Nocardia sp. NPDC004068]|uniref:PP2C family serine/threonine-protein phosphatase n=1 Tax=Nocardia sp. NPDC004068 TaxID=3364303 RepID=UPI00368D5702